MNNLLLALITQEFSLAVFRLRLNNSINCPRCFSLSLRYSIYKVQPSSVDDFDILSQSFPFVKNFFTFSFKFRHIFAVLHESLHILPWATLFVKHFLKNNLRKTIPLSRFLKKAPEPFLSPGVLCFLYSASSISPYPPSSRRYTIANDPPLSVSRKAKKS